jgi:hypothetical protein
MEARNFGWGKLFILIYIRKGASGQGESCGEIAWLIADGKGRRGEGRCDRRQAMVGDICSKRSPFMGGSFGNRRISSEMVY